MPESKKEKRRQKIKSPMGGRGKPNVSLVTFGPFQNFVGVSYKKYKCI
jgi:hypothetical protein